MVRVRNKHASRVGGVDPGVVGDVPDAVVRRWPWAFVVIEEPREPEEDQAVRSARAARAAIRESNDLAFVQGFVEDPRSSVRADALRRIKALTK